MCTAAQGCCWSIVKLQFEDHVGTDLNSGCNPWMETCDVYGGAELLLERRLFPVCGPRLCRPGLRPRLVVHLFGYVF